MKRNTIAQAVDEQVSANRSALHHADSFAAHRARQTAEILRLAPAGGGGRLCLLGAGNAHDVDLAALAGAFAEVHLVDVDRQALEGARGRVPAGARERLRLHAPVDVSGTWARLEDWARRPGAGDTLNAEVAPAVERVLAVVPAGFDVAVSCCVLTQLQLTLLHFVGDRHPVFEALRALMNAVHVRLLAGLLRPGGQALLVTDLTSDDTYPLDAVGPDDDLGKLMADLLAAGNVIHAAHPGLLSAEIRRDPALAAGLDVRWPIGPWLWHNGPERIFLVYGLEITRRPAPETALPPPVPPRS